MTENYDTLLTAREKIHHSTRSICSRETHPITYKVLLCESVLYYRRSKSVYRYDKCVLSELAKFFLGETRDTTVMAAFLGTLVRDSDSEGFSARIEEYIGPDLEDGEVRWEIHLD